MELIREFLFGVKEKRMDGREVAPVPYERRRPASKRELIENKTYAFPRGSMGTWKGFSCLRRIVSHEQFRCLASCNNKNKIRGIRVIRVQKNEVSHDRHLP